MKKFMIIIVAFVMIMSLCTGCGNVEDDTRSDVDIMNSYIANEIGENCYGKLVESDGKHIKFEVYDENGEYILSIKHIADVNCMF